MPSQEKQQMPKSRVRGVRTDKDLWMEIMGRYYDHNGRLSMGDVKDMLHIEKFLESNRRPVAAPKKGKPVDPHEPVYGWRGD